MKSALRYSEEASFRPRKLQDYSEPVTRPAVRQNVQPTFWQKLLKAIGF
jgi:hypothetical protein